PAAIEHHDQLELPGIILTEIAAKIAQHRFDAALFIVCRDKEQQTRLSHDHLSNKGDRNIQAPSSNIQRRSKFQTPISNKSQPMGPCIALVRNQALENAWNHPPRPASIFRVLRITFCDEGLLTKNPKQCKPED